MTDKIGIREAKIHLSKYLRMVKQGREIIVTERGRPIVKIVPIEKDDIPLKERVKRLEDSGILESEKKAAKMKPPIPIKGGKTAQAYLMEDREGQ